MRKVTTNQVRELLLRFYQDFHSELRFETDLAVKGDWQWSRSSKDERLAARFAYEVAGKVFRKHYMKAVHTPIEK